MDGGKALKPMACMNDVMDAEEPAANAEPIATPLASSELLLPTTAEPQRGTIRRVFHFIASALDWLFGGAAMIVILALLVATPVFQFLTLGYFLEAASRLAKTGRIRDAFIGIRTASRVGSAFLGAIVISGPLYFINSWLADALVVDSAALVTVRLNLASTIVGILTAIQIVLAVARGGRFLYFLRPISNLRWAIRRMREGGYLRDSVAGIVRFIRALRLPHYFTLGVRCFVAGFAWLVIPSAMLVAGRENPGIGLLGGLLLTLVLCYVPFLQVHVAVNGRLGAMRNVGTIRELFRHAPLSFLIAFLLTLALALPLYLLKIETVPRDALWLPALLFIVTIFPLKLLVGWAYYRGWHRPSRSTVLLIVPCRILMFPVAVIYSYIVFLSQYTGWHGALGIFEHHAFLLPVPF